MIQNSEIQKRSLMKNDPLLVLDSYLTSTPLWRQTMLAFRFLVPFQQLFIHMQAIPKYIFFLTLSFLYEWKRNNFFSLLFLLTMSWKSFYFRMSRASSFLWAADILWYGRALTRSTGASWWMFSWRQPLAVTAGWRDRSLKATCSVNIQVHPYEENSRSEIALSNIYSCSFRNYS